MMRIWWRLTVWRRALGRGVRGEPAAGDAEERDQRLSAYLDGDWSATATPALQSELAGDPELRSALDGMRQVRNALAQMGEVRAPRPFTLEAAPAPPRASRPELATRIGAAAAAMLLAAVLIGDVATTGNGRDTRAEAPAAARAELASPPAAAPETAGKAAAGAATPAVPALAAPAPRPEAADERAGADSAPVEKPLAPPAAAAPTGTEQAAAAVADGGGAVRALEIALLAATVALAAAAAGQWALRRRG